MLTNSPEVARIALSLSQFCHDKDAFKKGGMTGKKKTVPKRNVAFHKMGCWISSFDWQSDKFFPLSRSTRQHFRFQKGWAHGRTLLVLTSKGVSCFFVQKILEKSPQKWQLRYNSSFGKYPAHSLTRYPGVTPTPPSDGTTRSLWLTNRLTWAPPQRCHFWWMFGWM